MKKFIAYSLLFLLSFITNSYANTKEECIQATFSLLYHVNQELSALDIEDKVLFDTEDVESLWTDAFILDSQIELAKNSYDLWSSNPKDQQSLVDCKDYLMNVWTRSNQEIKSTIQIWQSHQYGLNNLNNNPLVSHQIKKEVSPYLLPLDSPVALIADMLFSTRVTYNKETLAQAGFNILKLQPRSFIAVASHPSLPGKLFKLYFDTEIRQKLKTPGWKWFVHRCTGANKVRNVIDKKNIKHFVVPEKHIYVLPPQTAPVKSATVDPKVAVLIVQDMQLVSKEQNLAVWKYLVTPEILDEFYAIISRANGSSYRPDNVAFTQFGKFAFIDTEYPHQDPDYISIMKYLSSEMQAYWSQLVKKAGKR